MTVAEADIRAARQRSNDAIRRGDVESFAATLDSDFNVVCGNGDFIPTRYKYIAAFKRVFDDPQGELYVRVCDRVEVSETGALAAEHGRWTGARPDGSIANSGTYLAMWRLTKTGWKLRCELFVQLT